MTETESVTVTYLDSFNFGSSLILASSAKMDSTRARLALPKSPFDYPFHIVYLHGFITIARGLLPMSDSRMLS